MSRIVVILGRKPCVDMEKLVQQAWREKKEVVVLTLGYPMTREQTAALDPAMDAAGRGAIDLEATLAFTPEHAAVKLDADDRVTFAASRAEERRIRKALRRTL